MIHMRHALVAGIALATFQTFTASAQNARSFVSRNGSDAAACTLAAPCKSFAGAHARTNAKGVINCLDPAEYGALVITKSITINCEAARASVEAPFNGYGIQLSTAPSDRVTISGVDIEGALFSNGIALAGSPLGELHVSDVSINGCAIGILFAPTNISQLVVKDSRISGNASEGLFVSPQTTGAANVHLSRVRLENNGVGLHAYGFGSAIGVNINMQDGLVAGNANFGVQANTGSGKAPVAISITSTQISGNFGPGLEADAAGGSALIRVNASMITANASAIGASGGGHVRSLGDNHVGANGGGEIFTGRDSLK